MYPRIIPTLNSTPFQLAYLHLYTTPRPPKAASSQSNRRNRIQYPRHLVRRHLTVLHTPHLAALAQALQSNGQLPALRFIDEEDVFLAVCVADRSAEDV
jgi:hypothetical protein